ncbi:MAG: FG-GAP repeat protein [Anaerolineales bacterium]|nr:FG-GAP repeat protein [Anaerolineales bacterium]
MQYSLHRLQPEPSRYFVGKTDKLVLILVMILNIFWISPTSFQPTIAVRENRFVGVGQLPSGLTPREWSTIQNIVIKAEYQFTWQKADADNPNGYYWSHNLSQGLQVYSNKQGLTVTPQENNAWSWGITLTRYGYEGALILLDTPLVIGAEKERMYYQWDSNISEWWINEATGLEQGFTLRERPVMGREPGPLLIEMAVTSNLTPLKNGNFIAFVNDRGDTILTYDELHIIDASGNIIPAQLQLIVGAETYIQILIDDNQAVYPLMIDPFVQTAKLTTLDTTGSARFGWEVAIDGDTAVVVAYYLNSNTGFHEASGFAYVFVRSNDGWVTTTESARLTPSDPSVLNSFGNSVKIRGDTIVVGVDHAPPANTGAAYVFVRPSNGWATMTETAVLTASDGDSFEYFGKSVAISEDTIVIGATGSDESMFNDATGSAYVFERPAGGWVTTTETAKLTTSDADFFDWVGCSVAISGETIVVGARYDDDAGTSSGSAYVFERPEVGWVAATETAKLSASDAAPFDFFGVSVAISGDTIVIGAPGDGEGLVDDNTGAAYVFERPDGGWATTLETAKLSASNGEGGDNFGYSVDILGDTILVGAYGNNNGRGVAYVFERPTGGWITTTETAILRATDAALTDFFGWSVAITENTILVGEYAYGDSSAYIFEISTGTIVYLPMIIR